MDLTGEPVASRRRRPARARALRTGRGHSP